ncbi:MAG: hypothetical protein ACYC6Z_10570 [Thermoleophilia bacterium]
MKTTFLPAESQSDYLDEVRQRVMDVISQQPGVPFSIYLLAEMLGMQPDFIEAAFIEFKGPEESPEKPGAILHLSQMSKQVIYLP